MELISISVPEDSGVVGKRLEEVYLPPRSFIALVVKGNDASLPSPATVLEADDEIVAVTISEEEQTLYDILTGV